MSDKRKLPTKEVGEVAVEIYASAWAEDTEALKVACEKWLDLIGFSQSVFRLEFTPEKKLMDLQIHIKMIGKIGKKEYETSATSGYGTIATEENIQQVAAGMLLGIEAAIQHCIRKMIRELLYPAAKYDYEIIDALRTMAAAKA